MSRFKHALSQLPLTAKVSSTAALRVFLNPVYVLIALLGIVLSSSLVIWSLNLDLARHILFGLDGISISVRLQTVFWDPYWSVFTTFESFQALGIIIFSTLFGLNLALLTYVLKNHGFRDIPKKSSFGGTIFAVLAGGCVACGTSILAPLAATLGATSSAFLRDLSLWLNWAASILVVYSIYKLGLLASVAQARKKLSISNTDKSAED